MARSVGSAVKDEWVEYIPEIDGTNRTDKQPVSMEVHWLNGEEYRRFRKELSMKPVKGEVKSNIEEVNRKILAANVRNVLNYSVSGHTITNGDDLYRYGEPDVTDEILDVLTNWSRLEDGRRDKLSSQSVSS